MNTDSTANAETAPAPAEMTEIQYQIARRLARRFDHLWSNADEIRAATVGVEEVRNLTRYRFPAERIGIFAPDLDDGGNVVHETNSRRIRWIIQRDGATLIECHRRTGRLFALVVKCNESGEYHIESARGAAATYDVPPAQGIGRRHFNAAARAVGAIIAHPAVCRHDADMIGQRYLKLAGIEPHGKAYHAEIVESAFVAMQSAAGAVPDIEASAIESMIPTGATARQLAGVLERLIVMAAAWHSATSGQKYDMPAAMHQLFDS